MKPETRVPSTVGTCGFCRLLQNTQPKKKEKKERSSGMVIISYSKPIPQFPIEHPKRYSKHIACVRLKTYNYTFRAHV